MPAQPPKMVGSQDPYCSICQAPLEKLTAIHLRKKRRRVFTWCDRCDGHAESNAMEMEVRRKYFGQ